MSSPEVVSSVSSEVAGKADETPFFSGQVRPFGALPLDASAQVALRGKVESSLHHLFQVPQLIDGLTDYLVEVTSEDPQCAGALGL